MTPFSAMAPGALPGAWRDVGIAKIKANRSSLVVDDGITVLRVRSEESAGTVVHALDADPRATPVLSWRWKVDRVVEKADMTQKAGDDYAARVYVFFDLPLEELSFFQAMKIRIVRALYGEEVPTAAICYVWDIPTPSVCACSCSKAGPSAPEAGSPSRATSPTTTCARSRGRPRPACRA
jgi:hypothetical protein